MATELQRACVLGLIIARRARCVPHAACWARHAPPTHPTTSHNSSHPFPGSAIPSVRGEEPDAGALRDFVGAAAEHRWVAAQRRALGACGDRGLMPLLQPADMASRPAGGGGGGGSARASGGGSGSGRARGGGSGGAVRTRGAARSAASSASHALRRPWRLPPSTTAGTANAAAGANLSRALAPALAAGVPASAVTAAASDAAGASGAQLWQWLAAATSFAELEGLVASFGGSAAFSARHAALALRQLGAVAGGSGNAVTAAVANPARALLLAERAAARLGEGLAAREPLLAADAAGAVWGMARAPGFACEEALLEALLAVAGEQHEEAEQQQGVDGDHHQQQQAGQHLSGSELAMLAAGVTALGAALPPWLGRAAVALLSSPDPRCALEPQDLQALLLAAATQQQRALADVRALHAAAVGACIRQLPRFAPDALAGLVVALDGLGARAACLELAERAAQLLLQRREQRQRANGGSGARRREQQQAAARRGRGGDEQPYGALARHDPVLCVLLLAEQLQQQQQQQGGGGDGGRGVIGGSIGGGLGSGSPAFAAG